LTRIFLIQIAEQILDPLFARIQGGRDKNIAFDFTLEVEGAAAIDDNLVPIFIFSCLQIDRTNRLALPQRNITKTHIEEIRALDMNIAGYVHALPELV